MSNNNAAVKLRTGCIFEMHTKKGQACEPYTSLTLSFDADEKVDLGLSREIKIKQVVADDGTVVGQDVNIGVVKLLGAAKAFFKENAENAIPFETQNHNKGVALRVLVDENALLHANNKVFLKTINEAL